MSRYFTKDHEWIDVAGDTGTVGITDYAQGQLGDITFVELPAVDTQAQQGDSVAVVDSVKAASDIYAPVAGKVTEINSELETRPELVNTDAETDGWLFRIELTDASQLSALMDKAAYDTYVEGL